MKLTYVDANLLIAAARGIDPAAADAKRVLEDRGREFAASVFLQLEVLPKAIYHKNREEIGFYEDFFAGISCWADSLEEIVTDAQREAGLCGLAGMDALHVAAAASVGVDEFITAEKPGKPIHRARCVKVISLLSEGDD